MAPRPWYSCGSGGIRIQASSLSSATRASMSPRSTASPTRERSARWAGESGRLAPSGCAGSASIAARARCRALLTDASVVSSISATSAARYPSTSRMTSTARCWGGIRCRPETKASADGLLGLIAGLGALGPVGQPVEQGVRIRLQPDRLPPAGRLRRIRQRVTGAHGLRPPAAVAQRVQAAVRRDPVEPGPQRGPALEPGHARQAASRVSWTMSSASWTDPRIR